MWTFQYANGHCESLGEVYNVHHFLSGFNWVYLTVGIRVYYNPLQIRLG